MLAPILAESLKSSRAEHESNSYNYRTGHWLPGSKSELLQSYFVFNE